MLRGQVFKKRDKTPRGGINCGIGALVGWTSLLTPQKILRRMSVCFRSQPLLLPAPTAMPIAGPARQPVEMPTVQELRDLVDLTREINPVPVVLSLKRERESAF
jgi:hypothetical protein